MAGLKPPHVPEKPVPIFRDQDLPRLERTCAGRTFAQRPDAAVIAVLRATGVRAGEIARIRYCPDDPERSDVDLQNRTIRVRGKGRRERVVPIGHDAARALDRYIRARSRHAQAWRPQLWLGVSNRGPMTASGIYQMISRRGRQCGLHAWPHRFRHHFSHTWLDRGGAEGDLMELNGWTSPADAPPVRGQRPPRLRPHHGRPVMTPPSAPHPATASGSRTQPAMVITHAQVTARSGRQGSRPLAAPGTCPDEVHNRSPQGRLDRGRVRTAWSAAISAGTAASVPARASRMTAPSARPGRGAASGKAACSRRPRRARASPLATHAQGRSTT